MQNKSNENLIYQTKFNSLFEFSPISIWEEDLSELWDAFEKIRAEGVSDLKSYLQKEPQMVEVLMNKINIVNVNNATMELLEVESKKELVGNFKKLFNRNNINLFENELNAIWNKEKKYAQKDKAYSLKGNPLFTQLQFQIPQTRDESKHVFVSIIDLTKMKNIEKELLFEQEIYKTIFNFAPGGILIEDKNGIILECNSAYEDILGYKKNEMIGKDIRSLIPIENRIFVDDNIKKILNGEILIQEINGIKKDGTPSINSLIETRIPLPNGEFGVLSIATDVTETRQLQKKLAKREEIFSSLFNYSSDILVVSELSDAEFPRIVYVNNSAVEKYGYKKEEFVGKPISIYITEKEMHPIRLRKILNGETITFESKHLCKDGSIFPVQVTAKLVSLFGKKHIYSIARDISKEKEEKQLQEKRIKYLEASNKISEIILSEEKVYNLLSKVVNIVGETLNTDRVFIYDVNYKSGKASLLTVWNNKECKDLVPAEDTYAVEPFVDVLKYMLSHKKLVESYFDDINPVFKGEPSSILHDKQKIKTLLLLPFSFAEGNFLLLTLNQIRFRRVFDNLDKEFIRTITQQINVAIMKIGFLNKQKSDETELRKLSQAVEQSQAEVIITDKDGHIEYVNPVFTKVTGYSPEEVIGKTPRILKSGFTSEEEYKELWNTITAGKTWTGEFHNKKKNGDLFWESAVVSSIKNDKGEIENYLGIKEVITEKKLLLEKLKQAKINAEKSSELKSTFLSQMSHEIRTPVNTMISFGSLLKDEWQGTVTKDVEKCFNGLDRAGRRIIRTTELLLDLSEIKTGTYEPHFKNIDLNIEILGPLALEYKSQALERNLKFKYQIKAEDAVVRADAQSLGKVFRNLIENAIKFTKSGAVKLHVYKNNTNAVVAEISDTGIGISEAFLPKIYDEFLQEDIGYSRRYDGNGIGLTLVNEYCKLNNINIEVKSKKGEGTTFTLTFS